jgi:hypothetical protein
MSLRWAIALVLTATIVSAAAADSRVIDPALHHLRFGPNREWADFPQSAEGPSRSVRFKSDRNAAEWSLRLRHQDVRQTWRLLLNGKELGRLRPDENDMVVYFPVPAGAVVAGDNTLMIVQDGKTADDVRIGEIILDNRPVSQALSEATVEVSVADADSPGKATLLPSRITILNAQGALMSVGAISGDHLAVRPGVIYTGNGRARFGLPAGDYTIYAGRGFAYGLDSVRIQVRPGDVLEKQLAIRREVVTPGWISCDTHVHTLTYSGHGDASVLEQVIAIAGEGIELPVATEHNRQVDYRAAAVTQGVRKYFTPVVGNEVTTTVGHVNAFPLRADGPIPDFKLKDWDLLFASINDAGAKIAVLNHPRDLHAGFRPFDPARFVAISGERLDGMALRANAVEVVNSGALQTDVMRAFRDWFGLLNRGVFLTPVGASDSHDVSRYMVGQARTYIRCANTAPGDIDVNAAVDSLLKGRVMVSCGLLAEITVNGKYGPGDLVPPSDEVKVAVRVLGPSWVQADKVELYANGYKVREAKIAGAQGPGVKWAGEWTLPRFRHDVHLVAIATGPGVTGLYWPIAKPYQATSPIVERRVIGASGAVWIDSDGDAKRTTAQGYAKRLADAAGADDALLIRSLKDYDEAVAVQAASLLQARGVSVAAQAVRTKAAAAGAQVARGFAAFAEAWRESQIAKAETK